MATATTTSPPGTTTGRRKYRHDPMRVRQKYHDLIESAGELPDPAQLRLPYLQQDEGIPPVGAGSPSPPLPAAALAPEASHPPGAGATQQPPPPSLPTQRGQFRTEPMPPAAAEIGPSIMRGVSSLVSGAGSGLEMLERLTWPPIEDPQARREWEQRRGLPDGSYAKVLQERRAQPYGPTDIGERLRGKGEKIGTQYPVPPDLAESIIDKPGLLLNPSWWMAHGPAAAVSSAPFFVTGVGGAAIAGKTGAIALPIITESFFEGALVWDEKKRSGASDQEAGRAAALAFAINVPMTAVPAQEIFGGGPGRSVARQLVGGFAAEAGQEMGQEATSNILTGRPVSEGVPEAGVLGGALGLGMGALAPRAAPEAQPIPGPQVPPQAAAGGPAPPTPQTPGAAVPQGQPPLATPGAPAAPLSPMAERISAAIAMGIDGIQGLTYEAGMVEAFKEVAHRAGSGDPLMAVIYEVKADSQVRGAARKALVDLQGQIGYQPPQPQPGQAPPGAVPPGPTIGQPPPGVMPGPGVPAPEGPEVAPPPSAPPPQPPIEPPSPAAVPPGTAPVTPPSPAPGPGVAPPADATAQPGAGAPVVEPPAPAAVPPQEVPPTEPPPPPPPAAPDPRAIPGIEHVPPEAHQRLIDALADAGVLVARGESGLPVLADPDSDKGKARAVVMDLLDDLAMEAPVEAPPPEAPTETAAPKVTFAPGDRVVVPHFGEGRFVSYINDKGAQVARPQPGGRAMVEVGQEPQVTRQVFHVEQIAPAPAPPEAGVAVAEPPTGAGAPPQDAAVRLAAFHEEIAALKREEEEQGKTGHFLKPGFDPAELTEDDLAIWERVKSGEATREQFEQYRKGLQEAGGASRSAFGSFIANKMVGVLASKERAVAPPEEAVPTDTPVRLLTRAFATRLREGVEIPKKPSELRQLAVSLTGRPVDAIDADFIDAVYDGLEGAASILFAEKFPHGAHLASAIATAADVEGIFGSRTRTLGIRDKQQFSTPLPIAQIAAHLLGPPVEGGLVLEPSAGTGNLAEAARLRGHDVVPIEMDQRRADVLRELDYVATAADIFRHQDTAVYDGAIMNPPWEKGTRFVARVPFEQDDIADAFVFKTMKLLKDGARLVAVLPEHYMESVTEGKAKGLISWLRNEHTLEGIIAMPPDSYKTRGTNVGSVIVVARKGQAETTPTPLREHVAQASTWGEALIAADKIEPTNTAPRPTKEPVAPPTPPQNTLVSPEEAEAAEDDIRKWLGEPTKQPPAGRRPRRGMFGRVVAAQEPTGGPPPEEPGAVRPIPPKIMQALVKVGTAAVETSARIQHGPPVVTYGAWAETMAQKFGPEVVSLLPRVWRRIQRVEHKDTAIPGIGKVADLMVGSEENPDGIPEERPDTKAPAPTPGVGGQPPRGPGGGGAASGGQAPAGAGPVQPPGPGEPVGGGPGVPAPDVVAETQRDGRTTVTIRSGAGLRTTDLDTTGLAPRFKVRRIRDFYEVQASPHFEFSPPQPGRRGNPHLRLFVEPRSLAAVQDPAIAVPVDDKYLEGLSDEQRSEVDLLAQAFSAGHGRVAGYDVGTGKSRMALGLMKWLIGEYDTSNGTRGAARIIYSTKNHQNIYKFFAEEVKNVGGLQVGGKDIPWMQAVDYPAAKTDRPSDPWTPFPTDVRLIAIPNIPVHMVGFEQAMAHWINTSPGPVVWIADEVHELKNVYGTTPAASAESFMNLQRAVLDDENSQIFYFTATPAEDPDELRVYVGLREFGPLAQDFDNYANWITGHADQQGNTQGVAGAASTGDTSITVPEMEQLVREWKGKGKWAARSMWKGGQQYQVHEPEVAEERMGVFDTYVDFVRRIYTTATEFTKDKRTGKSFSKSAARSRMLVLAQLTNHVKRMMAEWRLDPTLDMVQGYLDNVPEGEIPKSIVVSIVEGAAKGGAGAVAEERAGRLDAAISLINDMDKEGDTISDAQVAKQMLADELETMPQLRDIVKTFQERFGENKVAIITGQIHSLNERIAMLDSFQKGEKPILIISDAGSAGLDAHHVYDSGPGHRQRVFLPIDYDWSATKFFQRMGRVDRANQITSPIIALVKMPFRSELKFLTTVANRLRMLGVTSRGQADVVTTSNLSTHEIDHRIGRNVVQNIWDRIPPDYKSLFLNKGFYHNNKIAHTALDVRAGSREYLNDLLLMPHKVANDLHDMFMKRYAVEYKMALDHGERLQTERGKGRILRSMPLAEDLTIHDVATGHMFAWVPGAKGGESGWVSKESHHFSVVSGIVMSSDLNHMNRVRQVLEQRDMRHYVTIETSDAIISGHRVPPGRRDRLARVFNIIDLAATPDTLQSFLDAGEKVPMVKVGAAGKQWVMRRNTKGQYLIGNAVMKDRPELSEWAAGNGIREVDIYAAANASGEQWHVPGAHLASFARTFRIAPNVRDDTTPPPGGAGKAFGLKPKRGAAASRAPMPPQQPSGQSPTSFPPDLPGAAAVKWPTRTKRSAFRGVDPFSLWHAVRQWLPRRFTESEKSELKGRIQFAIEMSRKMQRNIRINAIRNDARALADYHPGTQLTRTKGAPTFGTLAHEDLGHHFQMMIYGGSPNKFAQTMHMAVEAIIADMQRATGGKPADRRLVRKRIQAEIRALLRDYAVSKGTPIYSEAFAEWARLTVEDPAEAQRRAPTLSAIWAATVREFPELQDMVDWARSVQQAWDASPEYARAMTHLHYPGDNPFPTKWQKFMYRFLDSLDSVKKLGDALVREGAPVPDPTEDLRMIATTQAARDGLTMRAILTDTWEYGASYEVGRGISLKQALGSVADRAITEIDLYFVAREADYLRRTRGWSPERYTGLTGKEVDSVLARHAVDDAMKQAYDKYQEYNNWLLRFRWKAGFLTRAQYIRIKNMNEVYTPLMRWREFIEADQASGSGAAKFAGRAKGIYRREGGVWPIVSPIQSTLKQTRDLMSSVEGNRVGQLLIRLARSHPEVARWGNEVPPTVEPAKIPFARIAEALGVSPKELVDMIGGDVDLLDDVLTFWMPSSRDPRKRTISAWIGGKKKYFQFRESEEQTYQAMLGLDGGDVSILSWLFGPAARIMRESIVLWPPFWARQARDLFAMKVRTQKDAKIRHVPKNFGMALIGTDFARSILERIDKHSKVKGLVARWNSITPTEMDELLVRGPGTYASMAHFLSLDPLQMEKFILKHISSKPYSTAARGKMAKVRQLVALHPTSPVRWANGVLDVMRQFGMAVEMAPRLTEMRAMGADTIATEDDMIRVGYAGRMVTIDFAQGGAWAKKWAVTSAFFKPNVLGWKMSVDTFTDPKTRSTAWRNAVLGITLPTIALVLLRHALEREKDFDSIPIHIRTRYWMIPLPNGGWYQMPKPHEFGLAFATSLEALFEWARHEDPGAFEAWAAEMWRSIPDPTPTLLAPIIQNYANWRGYSNTKIVSGSQERRLPEAQYYVSTSNTAKAIADLMGSLPGLKEIEMLTSPAKVENLISGYVPGLGTEIIDWAELAGAKAGITPERYDLSPGTTGIGRVFHYVTPFNTEPVRQLYEQYMDAANAHATLTFYTTGEMRDEVRAKRFREEHVDALKALPRLRNTVEQVNRLRKREHVAGGEEKERLRAEADALARSAVGYRQPIGLQGVRPGLQQMYGAGGRGRGRSRPSP